MSKITVLIFLALVSVTCCENFFWKFAYSQIFIKCFGDEAFYNHLQSHINATKTCFLEPTRVIMKNASNDMMLNDLDDPIFLQENSVAQYFGLVRSACPFDSAMTGHMMGSPDIMAAPDMMGHSMESPDMMGNPSMTESSGMSCGATTDSMLPGTKSPLIESDLMKVIMMKAAARISNYTCALQKLGYVDENLNILFDVMKDKLRNITDNPVKNMDFVRSINYCQNISMCLPNEDTSAMPVELRRIIVFWKCHKDYFLSICMKAHLHDLLKFFDLSHLKVIPNDEDALASALLGIFWGAGSEDLEL